MKLVFVSIYPEGSMTRYMLSSYALTACLQDQEDLRGTLEIAVLNFSSSASHEFIRKRILAQRPDVVGWGCYVWNIDMIRSLLPSLQQGLPAILGGPEISIGTARKLAEQGLGDFYIEGEGEFPICELMRHLALNAPFPAVVGRREGNRLTATTARTNHDVASLASPYLSGAIPANVYVQQQAFVETQRGCRYRCAYCVYHRGRLGIEYRNIDLVFAELRHLIVESDVKAIRFIDAVFTSDLERAKDIVRYLGTLRAEHALPWIYWEFSYSSVDEEFMELLSGLREGSCFPNNERVKAADRPQEYSDLLAGYTAVNCLGLQSLNKPSLKAVGRPAVSLKKFDAFMKSAARHGIALKIDMILGLPHESRETFFAGLDVLLPYMKGTDHILNVHRLQLLPGSRLEELTIPLGLDFAVTPPHTISVTPTLSIDDLEELSRLSGLLFRVLNSPLRRDFYSAYERFGNSCEGVLRSLLERASKDEPTRRCGLFTLERVDDIYWNGPAFREISSDWLRQTLTML